jgi:endonuclease/exonuclease/phosphatase family metal-dependent hydrolase
MSGETEAVISGTSTPDYDFETPIKTATFTAASYLTDPACKVHELFRRLFIVQALYPTSWQVTNLARKAGISLLGVGYVVLSPLGLLGIFFRAVAANLQTEPYIHWKGNLAPLQKRPGSFSLLSWNVGCVGAGYVITDAGLMPWPFRINAIADKIQKEDADVVCLYEVFDIKTAQQLYDKMKNQYAHFYFHVGPRATGLSSGFFIASKYDIQSPSFTPFPKEMLVGRTKNAEKGVFSFDLGHFATIFTTHLQQSEEPAHETPEEIKARREEMEFLMKKVDTVKNRAVIVTGDLNMRDNEYKDYSWSKDFDKGDVVDKEPSWGGDQFCASLVKKKVSGPLNLDHTMIKKGTAQAVKTCHVKTGFDGTQFRRKALSDHVGLRSEITLL